MKKKRRGYIDSIGIKDGVVVYNVTDADLPNRTYEQVISESTLPEEIEVIPVGAEVVCEKFYDEQWIISGVLTAPPSNSTDIEKIKSGAESGLSSWSLSFGPRNKGDEPETIAAEYREDGYVFRVNVAGDITLTNKNDAKITLSKEGNITLNNGDGYGMKIGKDGAIKIAASDVDIYTDGTTL